MAKVVTRLVLATPIRHHMLGPQVTWHWCTAVLASNPDGQPLLFNSTVAEVVTNVVLATPIGYYHLLGQR